MKKHLWQLILLAFGVSLAACAGVGEKQEIRRAGNVGEQEQAGTIGRSNIRLAVLKPFEVWSAYKYREIVGAGLDRFLSGYEDNITVIYSFYDLAHETRLDNPPPGADSEEIWLSRGWFSKAVPNTERVVELGRRAGFDAAVLYFLDIGGDSDYVYAYCVDADTGSLFLAKGRTDRFSGGEGEPTVAGVTARAVAEWLRAGRGTD